MEDITQSFNDPIKIEPIPPSITKDQCHSVQISKTINDIGSSVNSDSTEINYEFIRYEELEETFVDDDVIDSQPSTDIKHEDKNSNVLIDRESDKKSLSEHKKTIFSDSKALNKHKKVVDGNKKYNCDYCKRSYASKSNWEMHIKSKHLDQYGATCDICNKQFRHKVYVTQHIMTVHFKTEKLNCDVCNKLFANHKTLQNHKNNIHNYEKSFKCDVCNKQFAKLTFLNSHKRRHFEAFEFICNYCGRGFYSKHNLENHMNVHTGFRPYSCNECGKTFKQYGVLRTHLLTHKNIKPFKCKVEGCDRAYSHGTDLKRHRFSVHGLCEKEYICTICSKVYAENKSLKKHMESHNKL